MKITLNFSQFLDNWPKSREDQFSYEAKKAIFEYIEEYEESTGEETEFDPIAICCEWTEYNSALEAANDYQGFEIDTELSDDDNEEAALSYLQDSTVVLELDNGGIVIQQF